MLRVNVDHIQPGMVLARPIPLPHDARRYLLQRDIEIPMDLVPRLKQLGVLEVWIRNSDLEFLETIIDEGLGDQQREVYAIVRKNFESVMRGAALDLDIRHFQDAIGSLFDFLKASSCGNMLLQKLDAFDNYLMSHSTNVCYLALLTGMRLERYMIQERNAKTARDAKDLRQLGLGCLLHDIGKMHIPYEILNKPGKFTPEEYEIMKTHPVIGYNMLKGQIHAAAAQVVLNHHQRFDGKGYPQRVDSATGEKFSAQQGKQIHIFSRIATIADIYDAATSQRVYSAAKPSVQVLHELRTWCKGCFDPVVERAFYEIIPPFPIGKLVKLNNGVEAVVVDFNPRYPASPKVQGLRDPYGERYADPSAEELDLALYTDLCIAKVDGVDVTPYLDLQQELTPEPSDGVLL
jgi:HD-GYP domain-containing protein (c-di-GMP phosphodiesterase class II)